MEISVADLHRFLEVDASSRFSEQKRIAFCYIKNNIAYDLFDNSEYIVLLDRKYSTNAFAKVKSMFR